ncbi:MAG: ribose 5-phosphate isomerase B [Vampirovibrio sp.]|nr:ribose 5-phosphate isomerase B [Vampirovibrio sp.]
MQAFVIGSDHAGFDLKQHLVAYLQGQGITVEDVGCHSPERCDYPDSSAQVAQAMRDRNIAHGILCCGSGIGVAMGANRHPWVRAVTANDVFTAKMSRLHNDANVLCMGQRFIAPAMAEEILTVFMNTAFEGGRHQGRVDKLTELSSPTTTGNPH